MNQTGQAGSTYTVMQLQGTANGIAGVIGATLASTSWAASPLMATKARFDQATLAWAEQNVAYNLSSGYLTVLLNDFADNALVKTCIDITRQRMQLT